MHIKKSSIRLDCCDFGDLPWHLSIETGAWLTATFFEFEVDTILEPTSSDLRTIFQQKDSAPCDELCKQKKHSHNYGPNCIEGILHACSWEEAREYIYECLSSDSSPREASDRCNQVGFLPAPPEEVQRRVSAYWETIEKFLQLPPTRVYWFENTTGAFFGDFCLWGFTILLINDEQKAGMVLDGGTMD